MIIKKKTAMLLSVALGASLFATTALADIASKSGYEQLKDALKTTAAASTGDSTGKFKNFTLEMSITLKDNGQNLLYENHVNKYDLTKNACEKATKRESTYWKPFTSYAYADKNTYIFRSPTRETYYVYTSSPQRPWMLTNPFKEANAQEIETIADAIVGSIEDDVVVTENPDGSKVLSGSLTEVQIPAIVNAASSYFVKTRGNPGQKPILTQDIHVKTIKGRAVINKNGIAEGIQGSAVLSGKDTQGQVHEVNLEVLAKLTGINSTTVSKPDLSGKTVFQQGEQQAMPETSNLQKFVGKYKNDIVIEKDGRFVKIGERIVEITHVDNKSIAGRYHEEYKSGFKQYAADALDFGFNGKFGRTPDREQIQYLDERGNNFTAIFLDVRLGRVLLSHSKQAAGFNTDFRPVLE